MKCFQRLQSSLTPAAPTGSSDSTMPYREGSTLNQILYINERHNKRPLPKNDDKLPLYEIISSGDTFVQKELFEKDVDNELSNVDKDWKHISLVQKRELIQKYSEFHQINITDHVKKTILKNPSMVNYSRDIKEIDSISIPSDLVES